MANGVRRRCCQLAETGADVSRFETPGGLSSWTGVCPGTNESAGRTKSAHILPGNRCVKAALGTAALSASRGNQTYMAHQIPAHRRPARTDEALVATEHYILTAAWHQLADGECHTDPGADHFTLLDPVKAKNNAI